MMNNQPQIMQQHFFELLSCLTSLNLKNIPIPKYRYPSAGSLYPVQVYIQVRPGQISNIKEGIYYFDPDKAALLAVSDHPWLFGEINQISSLELIPSFAFILIGKLTAIQPIYGALAGEFCSLEAGYMVQLLASEAAQRNIQLTKIDALSEKEQSLLAHACQLQEQQVICSLVASYMANRNSDEDVNDISLAQVALLGEGGQ